MVAARNPKPARIDYSGLAFPKLAAKPRKAPKAKTHPKAGNFAAILAPTVKKALQDYYAKTAVPKPERLKVKRGRKHRAGLKTRRTVKAQVFARDVTCRAYGVSPVCRKRPVDRHELIPMGRGGKITTANCVAVCRACHDAAQNALGGLPLAFDWDGKDRGMAPDADTPGAVWATWRHIWRGVKPKGRAA